MQIFLAHKRHTKRHTIKRVFCVNVAVARVYEFCVVVYYSITLKFYAKLYLKLYTIKF